MEDVSYRDRPGELIADVFNGDPAVEAEDMDALTDVLPTRRDMNEFVEQIASVDAVAIIKITPVAPTLMEEVLPTVCLITAPAAAPWESARTFDSINRHKSCRLLSSKSRSCRRCRGAT